MSSTRLPEKALSKVGEMSLLHRVVESLETLEDLGGIVVATSDDPSDDRLVSHCENIGVRFFRGDLLDVALRTKQIIQKFKPKFICRVCGDRPLLTPDFLECAKHSFLTESSRFDLITNLKSKLDPPGLKIEFMKSQTFMEHFKNLRGDEREHITKYFYDDRNFSRDKIFEFDFNTENHSEINLCIDTACDLARVNAVLEIIKKDRMELTHKNVYLVMKSL